MTETLSVSCLKDPATPTRSSVSPLPVENIITVDIVPELLKENGMGGMGNGMENAKTLADEDCAQTTTTLPTTAVEDDCDELASVRESMRDLSCCASSSDSSTASAEGENALQTPETTREEPSANGNGTSQLQQHSTLRPSSHRHSIMKPYDSTEIPVHQKRGSWLSLKPPAQTSIARAHSLPARLNKQAGSEGSRELPSRRRVSFVAVQIRHYEQTIGDNPSVSYGPPISLDWGYEQASPVLLEEYEASRGRRRTLRQMMLNYYHRKNVLTFCCGASEEELHRAQKAAEKAKRERALTKAMLGVSKIEEVWQAATRKRKKKGQK